MRRKKLDFKYVILISSITISIFLIVISYTIKSERELTFPEKIVKDTLLYSQKIIAYPFNKAGDFFDEKKEKDKVYDEYKELVEKNSDYELIIAENNSLKKEISDLKEQNQLSLIKTEYNLINATIINRNSGYFYDKVTIDVGENNDIISGMTVITNKGLIGVISKVSKYSSEVNLITASNFQNKLSVIVESNDSTIYGLLEKYNFKSNSLIATIVSSNPKIKKGLTVYTSGLSEMVPRGILIGIVDEVTYDEYGLYENIIITPAADITNLRYVSVVEGGK